VMHSKNVHTQEVGRHKNGRAAENCVTSEFS